MKILFDTSVLVAAILSGHSSHSVCLPYFESIPLTAEDYTAAIELMVQRQLPGGGIFDALIVQAALKVQADVLLTLNPKHFIRLGTVIASKVEVPQ
jgi:predicted nucleic acid-binding protein